LQYTLHAAALMAILNTPVAAATLQVYIPGGAPCAGACSYEWAQKEFEVPYGEPQIMTIPAGSLVIKMSYAKNGVAYWQLDTRAFGNDEEAIGYYFVDEASGRRLAMVRIASCQNWAVVHIVQPSLPVLLTDKPSQPLFGNPPNSPPSAPPFDWPIWPDRPIEPIAPPPVVIPPPVEVPPVTAVPLSPSIWFLLAALTGTGLAFGRKGSV